MATEKPRSNRLKGLNQAQQPIVVDCSESAVNAGVELKARGRLIGVSESRSAVVVDCQLPTPAAAMLLKLHFAPDLSDEDQVVLAANIFALVQALSVADRDLGGGGLVLADQRAEPAAVILTLRHANPAGATDRSSKLAQMLNNVVEQAKIESGAGVLKLLDTAATSSADQVHLLLAGSRTVSRCEVLSVAV
jgi:hypothetical protein